MIGKPLPVPVKKIASTDIPKFDGGLFMGGAALAPNNSITDSNNVELDFFGYPGPRRKMVKFLPDTVETTYQKYPVLWNGLLYYFTADNGQIVYCQEGDSGWTACGGTNTFVTNNGGLPKFLRVLDNLLILNGKNGDNLAYVDLTTSGFPIVKYSAIADPTGATTSALTGLSSGPFNIYYAYSYTASVGETNLSPIETISIDQTRDAWTGLSTPGLITLTRPGTPPAGAQFWNVYMATTATSGSIQVTDMLMIAASIDLSTDTFIDNGTLSLNLSSLAPIANSTAGPRVENGITFEGNPLLFGDQDN